MKNSKIIVSSGKMVNSMLAIKGIDSSRLVSVRLLNPRGGAVEVIVRGEV